MIVPVLNDRIFFTITTICGQMLLLDQKLACRHMEADILGIKQSSRTNFSKQSQKPYMQNLKLS